MSLEDTELSAELIVNTLINSAQREMDDGQGSSTNYNSISLSPELHKLVLLMHASNYEGQAVEPELFTQSKIWELCLSFRGHCDPYEIEILSDHEACLTFKKDVMLGLAAEDLMSVEDWMGVPVVITVIILGRSKIWAILDARERHRQSLKERTYEEGREDEEGLKQMDREKDKLEWEVQDYAGRQKELEKLVESLTDKVQKLGTQPVSGKGLVTSSTQNLLNSFSNLTTSFQVKADLDLGKFSRTEPVPNNELTFDQWRVDVQSYQVNVPDHILLPATCKSIMGKAQSVVRILGPSYTVEDVVKCLAREYEGVASSDTVFKEFYQLKQERGEKVQVFSIRLRDALANLSSRFLERAPREDHEQMLRDRFFYGTKMGMRNSIQHLYDDEKITFGELLLKARRNDDEEVLAKVTLKASSVETEVKDGLEEKVDKLLAVVKSGQMEKGKDKRDRSRTPKSTPTNLEQNTPMKRDREQDVRTNLQGLRINASGPFANDQKPIKCFKCKGWGHPRRLCPSWLNYMRGGITREPPSPSRHEMTRPHPSNPNTQH